MIAVIADDLSGAAELAGIGLGHGFTVELTSEMTMHSAADLLVINTASRVLKSSQASQIANRASIFLKRLKPDWIYKKTDSVLRGNVLAEISSILEITGLKKSLLIPANPDLGRTIIEGQYFINGQLLENTSFSDDPDFPCKTSNVLELLGKSEKINTGFLKSKKALPRQGVFIGEVNNRDSLDEWAKKVNKEILPAGAAEFFTTLFEKKGHKINIQNKTKIRDFGKTLFICGSSHEYSRKALQDAKLNGASICYMPENLTIKTDNQLLAQWLIKIKACFDKNEKVILAIPLNTTRSKETARKIENAFSKIVQLILQDMDIKTLVIEGGETAQSICNFNSIKHLYPKELLTTGVVSLSADKKKPASIIIKPGSYSWPQELWHFN